MNSCERWLRGGPSSLELQSAYRAGAGSEQVGFDAESLQHADGLVWQRIIVLAAEGQMLRVGGNRIRRPRQVSCFGVRVTVAQRRSEDDGRLIQQCSDPGFGTGQPSEKVCKFLELSFLNAPQLIELL